MKYIINLFIFIICFSAIANEQQKKRWDHLIKISFQELKIIEAVKYKDERLYFRMLQTHTELARLYKEKDNNAFLEASINSDKPLKKKDFFKKTLGRYKIAQNLAKSLLKKFPKTQYKAEIYYTLALNSRDFAYDNKIRDNLVKALKYARKGTDIEYYTKTSLAEYYYNNKNYKSAIFYYSQIIKNKKDDWYTKHLFNLGWCLLKVNRYDKAVEALEESYKMSSNGGYIDVRQQVKFSLATFYVIADKLEQGYNFFVTREDNAFKVLFKMSKKIANNGNYKKTNSFIAKVHTYITDKKLESSRNELYLFELEFNKNFKNDEKFFQVATSLSDRKRDKKTDEQLLGTLSEYVSNRQLKLSKGYDRDNDVINDAFIVRTIGYFDLLTKIDPIEKPYYLYMKGETYSATGKWAKAIPEYKYALVNYDKKACKEDIREKTLNSLFISTEKIQFNKEDKEKEVLFAFNQYLKYWPKNKKSKSIYERLFGIYAKNKDMSNIEKNLTKFAHNHKSETKKHHEQVSVILDFYIKDRNTKDLSRWVNTLRTGKFNYPTKKTLNAELILSQILFKEFENYASNGKVDQALKGYISIFENENYTKKIKADSAYNAALLYVNNNNEKDAIKWFNKSFKNYNKKDLNKRRAGLVSLSSRLFVRQNFTGAAKINKFTLGRFCKKKDKINDTLFEQLINMNLANDHILKTNHVYYNMRKCSSNDLNITAIGHTILDHMILFNKVSDASSFFTKHAFTNSYNEKKAEFFTDLYWKTFNKSKTQRLRYLKSLNIKNCSECTAEYQNIKTYEDFLKRTIQFVKSKIIVDKDFKPETFNANFSKRLGQIPVIIKEGEDLLKRKNGNISISVFNSFTLVIDELMKEINGYAPPVKDPNFQKAFKAQMAMIQKQMGAKLVEYRVKAGNIVDSNSIISYNFDHANPAKNTIDIADIRYPSTYFAIPRDLTGGTL